MLAEKHEKILVCLRGFELPVTVQVTDIAKAAGYKISNSKNGTPTSFGAAGAMVKLRKRELIDYQATKGYTIKWVSPDGVETFGDVTFEPSTESEQIAEIPDDEVKPYIENTSISIRDQRVMIDRDLAKLYGVKTERLNQQRERNPDKFPEDFAFQMSDDETLQNARLQNTTFTHPPWVYTLEGGNRFEHSVSGQAFGDNHSCLLRPRTHGAW